MEEDKASLPSLKEGSGGGGEVVGLFSCWGRFKSIKLLSFLKRSGSTSVGCCNKLISSSCFKGKHQTKSSRNSCRYDPLSYAQNFDEGCLDDNTEDYYSRGFSSRFAAPVHHVHVQRPPPTPLREMPAGN